MPNPYPGSAAMLIAGLDDIKKQAHEHPRRKKQGAQDGAAFILRQTTCALTTVCRRPAALSIFDVLSLAGIDTASICIQLPNRWRIDGPAHCNDFKYRARLAGASQASLVGL
jgi:hypothetical protein